MLGVVTYLGMGLSLLLISLDARFGAFKLRRAFLLLTGLACPVVFFLMVLPELGPWRGLLQRLLDLSMAASLSLIVWTLLPTERRARGAVA